MCFLEEENKLTIAQIAKRNGINNNSLNPWPLFDLIIKDIFVRYSGVRKSLLRVFANLNKPKKVPKTIKPFMTVTAFGLLCIFLAFAPYFLFTLSKECKFLPPRVVVCSF